MIKCKRKSAESMSNLSIPSTVRIGLLDCYDFISPNEYSSKTLGLLAFLLRKSVGDINFSEIFNEFLKYSQLDQQLDLITLLNKKRDTLPENGASIEKCLMLNRWITYLEHNKIEFMSSISEIAIDMQNRIIDNQSNQTITYPDDFRQREKDFHNRANAQNIRRLFYYNPDESKAPSLIHLQNRTTEHLSYIIDSKMRYDRQFRDLGIQELEKIISTSFMITNQPHCNANPVLIYELRSGIFVAKVSVTIVSLLYDFMKTHSNIIELFDIKLSLCSTTKSYELDESQKLSWQTCELKIKPDDRSQIIQFAELTEITIKKMPKTAKPIRFAEELHTFTFRISLRLNLNEHKISTHYEIPLQSLPFAIGAHNNHIPYLLTKVMISDIQRFSQLPTIDVKIILQFVLGYFKHRTGIEPKQDLQDYLEQELINAKDKKPNSQSLEDIFIDALFPFVNQIDFIGKHPILAMFYAEGLFLGPCNSQQAASVMRQLATINSPIVGLRCNGIKTDSTSTKSMKSPQCFVRVDIYNALTDNFQNRTFEYANFSNDLLKFVSTAKEPNTSSIRILSNLTDLNTDKTYEFFKKYYHERLHDIYKTDPNYKLIIDLLRHIDEDDNHQSNNGSQSSNNSQSDSPLSTTTTNHENKISDGINDSRSTHDNQSIFSDTLMQNTVPSYSLTNDQEVIKYVLANPSVFIEIIRQFRNMQGTNTNISTPSPPQQQQQQQQQLTPIPMHVQYYPPMAQLPQQPSTLFVMPNQPMNTNSYQHVPGNGIQILSTQYARQTQYIPIPTNSPSSSSIHLDQISSDSMNDDNEPWTCDLFSSPEISQ